MKNKMLLFLLSLLGFTTSCKETLIMYGTPRATLKVKGKVCDPSGNPIAGIRVRAGYYASSEESADTGADGTYELTAEVDPGRAQLLYTDVDGPLNGGDFADQTLVVEFSNADKIAEGDDVWDDGTFARSGVDVTMQEKE